uniref:L-serine ammonia-lyase n=1 Tax=Plectus sambesii TaxID=2011161 RepID=A0A914VTF1_9BILA
MSPPVPLVDLKTLQDASAFVKASGEIRQTPVALHVDDCLRSSDHGSALPPSCTVHLKLENAQVGGSFKLRGVVNQIAHLDVDDPSAAHLFTISGGNYGKAFATLVNRKAYKNTVLMPTSAPLERVALIESLGSTVVRVDTSQLLDKVQEYQASGLTFVDSIDDHNLVNGYSSLGFELADVFQDIDVLLVPCGGGGLLAGISAAFGLLGRKTKVFGVEPETADSMRQSFERNEAVKMPGAHSVASGLAPPFAGRLTFPLCKQFAAGICTVSDSQIIAAMKTLHESLGLLVEPSGAAGVAALLFGKVPVDLQNKTVVVVISGGNISLDNFRTLSAEETHD